MDTSYLALASPVNPVLTPLPSRILSFYRWLRRWHSQTQDIHASTGYFARKQGVSERTIYRWLAALRRAGYIRSVQVVGVERRITPLAPMAAPPGPKKAGVRQGSVSGVTPYRASDAVYAETTTCKKRVQKVSPDGDESKRVEAVSAGADGGLVGRLVQRGVSPFMAVHLVSVHGGEVVREQLEAIAYRKVFDQAAALVASIRGRWSLPGALLSKREEERQRAQKAAKRSAVALMAQEEAKRRQDSLARLSGLSEQERAALEAAVRADLSREMPAAARLMLGTAAGAALVRGKMLAHLGGC